MVSIQNLRMEMVVIYIVIIKMTKAPYKIKKQKGFDHYSVNVNFHIYPSNKKWAYQYKTPIEGAKHYTGEFKDEKDLLEILGKYVGRRKKKITSKKKIQRKEKQYNEKLKLLRIWTVRHCMFVLQDIQRKYKTIKYFDYFN